MSNAEDSTDVAQPREVPPTLLGQFAGEAVIRELLRLQAIERPRSATARLFGRTPLGADSVPWYVGALGERAVGHILSTLGEEWRVLHSIPVGNAGADIDHLVLGPGGIITINTKNHADKRIWVAGSVFMVSGQRQPYIRNSELEARRVTSALSAYLPAGFEVTPLIALLDPAALTVKEAPAAVSVVDAHDLARWISKRPRVLDPHQLRTITDAALRRRTWQAADEAETRVGSEGALGLEGAVGPEGPPGPEAILADFDLLDAEVRQARRRRLSWAFVGLGALVVACALLAPLALQLL